jgi:predicted nucleic acid-binding protein
VSPKARAFGGETFIADTSAWHRASHPRLSESWSSAVRGRQIATCPIVVLEILYSAQNGEQFDELADALAQLRDIPLTRSVTRAAQHAYRELAQRQPRYHRSVALSDLLIAACAQDAGVGVLHYDEDFDRLAEVLSFESRWVAPRGSL